MSILKKTVLFDLDSGEIRHEEKRLSWIDETTLPKAVEAKKAVAAMKQEMKEYLAKGGKPEEFLSYYYSELKEAHEIWKESHFKLIDAMKKDPALAPQVEQELNTFLESKGIRPVMMPPKLKERLGIE